jgi:hypothetical protein
VALEPAVGNVSLPNVHVLTLILIDITDHAAERFVRTTHLATYLGWDVRNFLDADFAPSYSLKNRISPAYTRGPVTMVEERPL